MTQKKDTLGSTLVMSGAPPGPDGEQVTPPNLDPMHAGFGGGRYKIVSRLGDGGMGVVYHANDTTTGAEVALKILANKNAAPEVLDRFLLEARVGLAIVDENVRRLFDVGIDPVLGTPYMVMELLRGVDLETRLRTSGGQLPHPEACDQVMAACAGLAAVHAKGVVHRDVKLSNLFLADTGAPQPVLKLLDFGVSKAPGFGASLRLTKTGDVIGTPFYMAPEQMRSARGVDRRADVWSLGIVLYELLTGEAPFEVHSVSDVFISVLQQDHVPLHERRSDLPPALSPIIDMALAKDRDRRFRDVPAIATALAPYAPHGAAFLARIRARAGEDPLRRGKTR